MAAVTMSFTCGHVQPTWVPLSSSALRSTKVSCCSSPNARSHRASSRAAVVLPAPGLPVSTTLRHPSNSRGSPPRCTYSTFARSWDRNALRAPIPVSPASSASTSRR
eukprot:scaffold23281_cov120-Isochrysis_galbana.AAC.5